MNRVGRGLSWLAVCEGEAHGCIRREARMEIRVLKGDPRTRADGHGKKLRETLEGAQ